MMRSNWWSYGGQQWLAVVVVGGVIGKADEWAVSTK